MIASYPNRHFQLWEYKVSHGSLLVRSPKTMELDLNVDIVFSGVELVSMPRHLHGLDFARASLEDRLSAKQLIGHEVAADRLFILISRNVRYKIIAANYKVNENAMEIFDSPFQ